MRARGLMRWTLLSTASALALAAAAFAACSDDPNSLTGGVPPEGGVSGGDGSLSTSDADLDASVNVTDSGGDARADVETVYGDLRDASAWSMFSLQPVNANASGYFGGVFDGRYIYMAPMRTAASQYHGLVIRYDTQGQYDAGAAWSSFDISTLNAGARGYPGAVFDGKYVYFVPRTNESVLHGLAARYDTTQPFNASSSWTLFDMTTLNSVARGFQGAVFDGRYVYYVPFLNADTCGLVARYDTQGAFNAGASWTFFDATTVDPNAKQFSGGVFAGQHVYFVPYIAGGYSGTVARYDTTAAFANAGSWQTFDMTVIDPALKGYAGGVTDGKYVYFMPHYDGTQYSGLIPRYDTTLAFNVTSSWSTFDVTTVDQLARGFHHATFDGRYIYLSPLHNGTAFSGRVVRYDTQGDYKAASSWTTYDLAPLDPDAVGFTGAAFDGRYLFFVPNAGHTVARFDAKRPPSLPGLKGSYY